MGRAMRGRSFGFQAHRMILLSLGLVLIVSITFAVDLLLDLNTLNPYLCIQPQNASTGSHKLGLNPFSSVGEAQAIQEVSGPIGIPNFHSLGREFLSVGGSLDKPQQLLQNTFPENTFGCQQRKFISSCTAPASRTPTGCQCRCGHPSGSRSGGCVPICPRYCSSRAAAAAAAARRSAPARRAATAGATARSRPLA